MNDPESHLKATRLATPSESLDRRMQEAFDTTARENSSQKSPRMWQLVGAFTTMGLAATFFLIVQRFNQAQSQATPADTPITYQIELPVTLRPLLFESPASKRPPPQYSVSVGAP